MHGQIAAIQWLSAFHEINSEQFALVCASVPPPTPDSTIETLVSADQVQAFLMRNHSKDKDEQPAATRRPHLPALPNVEAERDPVQALFAYAYLQAQKQRNQAVEEIKQDADAISAVIQTQHVLAVSDSDLQGKLDYIIEQSQKITNADGAVIGLRDSDEIVCRARAGSLGPSVGARLDPYSGISGECIRTGEVLYCDDTDTDTRVNLSACRQLGIRSILAVPLILHEQTIGVIEIFSGWAGAFALREKRTLNMLAAQIVEAYWDEETTALKASAGTAEVSTEAEQPSIAEAISVPSLASARGAVLPETTIPDVPVAMHEPAAQIETRFDFLRSETEPKLFTPKIAVAVVFIATLLTILIWQTWMPRPSHLFLTDSSGLQVADPELQPTVTPTPSGQAHLTDVRHWSKKDYTTIALFLDAAVKYKVTALHDPERINVDLQDTSVAAELPKKKEMVVDVNNRLVARVLAAQEGSNARVVLDLKMPVEYNSVLSAESPYWLMIALHRRPKRH
jgi:hypothetical protein